LSSIAEFSTIKHNLLNNILEAKTLESDLRKNFQIDLTIKERIERIQNNIQSTNFTVAVVGVIKRGKSTLLNAILGDKIEILSTNVTPETAKLSYLVYDDDPYAIIHKTNGEKERIKIEDLGKYTNSFPKTRLNIRHKHKGVKELVMSTKYAEIHYPNEYLKNGVRFVDTPGVDDPDPDRSRVTEEFISSADAVIFLIDVLEGGLKESELIFMKNRIINRKSSKGVICVCNKILALRKFQQNELNDVLINTKDVLKKELNIEVPIFPVDAKAAYQGKLENNESLLEKSRFHEFLDGLETFLINEKGKIALKRLLIDLKANIIEPIIETLSFSVINRPNELTEITNQLVAYKKSINAQKEKVDKLQTKINNEKSNLKSSIESEIRTKFKNIIINNNDATVQLRNNLAKVIEPINTKFTNQIKHIFSDLLKDLDAYEVRLPNAKLMVETPNISIDDFYVTKQIISQTSGASLASAGIGAAAAGLLFATGIGVIIGAYIGYKIGQEIDNQQVVKTTKELDIKSVQNKLSEMTGEIITSYINSVDIYFQQFQSEINTWFNNKEEELNSKMQMVENIKSQKESEFENISKELSIYLDKAKSLLELTNNYLLKLEEL